MEDITAKILVEALPHIQQFYGKTIVIKYGGNAMTSEELKMKVMQDITLMKYVGIRPVIVHGGGPEITGFLKKVGKQTEFVSGLRVTDEETMEIVEMVLIGKINSEIVSLLNQCGNRAIGLSGKDAGLIKAVKKMAEVHTEGRVVKVDIGHVGEVGEIHPKLLTDLLDAGYIPVVAPVGVGETGKSFNINADYVAAEVAGALNAEKLLLLTNVAGVYKNFEDKESFLPSLSAKDAKKFIEEGIISGGMIPKVESCLHALDCSARRATILDGRIPHALLLELFTTEGLGTEIFNEEDE